MMDLEHPLHVAGAEAGAPAQPSLKITDDLLNSFGEMFHTALRKAVDSLHSVIAWNAIVLVPKDVYGAFCDYMTETLKLNPSVTFGQFAALLRGWSSKTYRRNLFATDRDAWDRLCKTDDGNRLRLVHIFDAAIATLPDTDIEDIMCFMEPE